MTLSSGQAPTLWLALVLAGAGLLACALMLVRLRRALRRIEAADRRLRQAQEEIDGLQGELLRHDQLEQALMQAKLAAEAAVLAKGEFLATMSHEIRTPLNGIVPMLDLVSRGTLAPDQREMLQTASASSLQLLRIVDDILDYSKLEADKLELETTGFDLRELMEGVAQLMQRAAEDKRLRLSMAIDPAVRLPVRGDPVRLRQVLNNLVGNAVKFTEHGGVDLHLRRIGETASQHVLRFQIRDTGIGIAPEQQARLFQPFTQADASTTRLYGGTGLGLVICQRIIGLMGGRIGVDSVLGQGTTFWFEIPLLKAVGDLPAPARPEDMRALLVSSDDALRARLQPLLRHWGMTLHCVDGAQQALERLRVNKGKEPGFGLVIADHERLRYSARALHRGILRAPALAGLRLLWLCGETPLPPELETRAESLPRQASDAELHAALRPTAGASAAADGSGGAAPARTWARRHPASQGREPRLLLVEDNPVNLMVARKMLATLGLQTEIATDGEAALASLRQSDYDLVLMDCQMPLLDGYEATRRWRALEAERGAARLPIVAMTANAMAGDRDRCLEAGMDDYLAKPVSREQLEACLARWLPGEGQDEAMAGQAARIAATPAAIAAGRPATLPILDVATLDELHEVVGAETAAIVRLFLEDAPRLIGILEAASGEHDVDRLREASHSLKSASANVGAIALAHAARRVELAARTEPPDRPAALVALVIAEYARARLALQGQLARLARPRAGADA